MGEEELEVVAEQIGAIEEEVVAEAEEEEAAAAEEPSIESVPVVAE